MMRPTLLMLHGWAFDGLLWDRLAACLPGYPAIRWDRGYFGAPAEPPVEGPVVAIGHSLGAMLLGQRLPQSVPLVAVNGFDRFTGPDGIPPRVMARMQARFAEVPRLVLNDFRARCGAEPTDAELAERRLADDLALLATGGVAAGQRQVLALQGGFDPILPQALRARAFPGAVRAEQETGGHLLPLTHPEWCAAQIEAFLCG